MNKKEEEFMSAHLKEIEKRYGKRRAATANIGWSESDDSICSKVYGDEAMCVTTFRKKVKGKYIHEHDKY